MMFALVTVVGGISGCASSAREAVVPTSTSDPVPMSLPSTPTTVAGLAPPPTVTEFRAPCPRRRTPTGGLVGLEDLGAHEALWQARRTTSYRYQLNRGLGIGGTTSVIVTVDGSGASPAPSAATLHPVGLDDFTIDSWFTYLHQLDDGAVDQPDAISVTWDADRGFPTAIQLDPLCNAIDDESVFTLSGFEALSG